MFKKKECVAMLLAGGQGSRLYALTTKTAKPAVQFGGKYRIIDFPLSNCINSGIDTVGVLTQYQPLVLNEYIGNGQPWDLDRVWGGVTVLPPYQGQKSADWYKGTANAIYQNMKFINRYDTDHVIILSGDHIYKMDYAKMLAYHKEKNADCTIAVIDVPIEEASRFGIMSAYEDGTIYKFTEKPKNPDSTKASMGIYIFRRDKLEKYLTEDEANENSSNDFGKNIIPNMLSDGQRMFAYSFEGYWKDVGTISSLWEANMDLLGKDPVLNIGGDDWRIYSRHSARGPQFVGSEAEIENCYMTEGCEIYGRVKNCVIGANVKIGAGAYVEDCVLMGDLTIESGADVRYAIIDTGVCIGANAKVGAARESAKGVTVIGEDVKIQSGAVIEDGAMMSESN